MSRLYTPDLTEGRTNYEDKLIILSAVANLLIALTLSVFGSQMYPFFFLVYLWIAFYVLFITTLIRREKTVEKPLIRKGSHLVGAAVLAIVIRLIFIGMTHHISLDALWYIDFGKLMHNGVVPYTGFYFPYPPVFAYFIYVITSIFQGAEGFRLFAIMMDVAVLIVLWKLVHQEFGPMWASTAAIAYAFLPISVIESGWNGHFEPLANLLLLLALWFLLQRKYVISGVFIGLAAATKIYPLVVFPILFTYIKDSKNRLWFTISAILSALLTFVPFPLLAWTTNLNGTSSGSQSNGALGLFESLFGFLLTLPFPSDIIAIGVSFALVLGVLYLMRQVNRDNPTIKARLYQQISLALGVILVGIGFTAGSYHLLPFSREVYWRYPVDVSIVRSIMTICLGLLILFNAKRDWITGLRRNVSQKSLLALIGATALLLIAMVRNFFYGWYLLWSIPFFLLLRDRRLALTIILGLLLVYPNYTYDNFASLGFEETRQWQDEFQTVEGWSTHIGIQGNNVNINQVKSHVNSDGMNGLFWFDTRNITDNSYLSNVTISFTKVVDFRFNETTEFASRIRASWDPPLGRNADLSLTFEGVDANDESIKGSIIPRTSVFTNLTYVLWRYAFSNLDSTTKDGTITILNLTIFPVEIVQSYYTVDFFYTTNNGTFKPIYFLSIPLLFAIVLAAFTILYLEFERGEKLDIAQKNQQQIINQK
ncbi:MAG: glycosyltransferase family 87 protein [Candidatus Thorarchaeota archaeon]